MNGPDVFVFDIDGTIANLDHRLHHVTEKPSNWTAFSIKMNEDKPIAESIRVLKQLAQTHRIVFLTGRMGDPDSIKVTEDWLQEHVGFGTYGYDLFMRADKDYRPDYIVKLELMRDHIQPNYTVIGIFEDRSSVVNMWRDEGFYVFDVNQNRRVGSSK